MYAVVYRGRTRYQGAEGVDDERRWVGEAPNAGGGADGGGEHGDGHEGGEADEGGDMDADDEDDDEYDTGMANEYAAGQGGAEPSPAAGGYHPGGGGGGGGAPEAEPAACEACDEDERMEEVAAANYMQADEDERMEEVAADNPGTARLPHSQPNGTRSTCPLRAPPPRAALSPRVRTGRDRRERSPP